jgi:hypothetical protein
LASSKAPASQSAAPRQTDKGSVYLEPYGCDPISVDFEPPPTFNRVINDDPIARWVSPSAAMDPFTRQKKKEWLDFMTLRAHCTRDSAGARRRAATERKVAVERQPEHPFEDANDPQIRKMRQKIEILTDESSSFPIMLEYRRTYPDGIPGGFTYESYEGRCWLWKPKAQVALELRLNTPLSREESARKTLPTLCSALVAGDAIRVHK